MWIYNVNTDYVKWDLDLVIPWSISYTKLTETEQQRLGSYENKSHPTKNVCMEWTVSSYEMLCLIDIQQIYSR